jgi:hypothetical protein
MMTFDQAEENLGIVRRQGRIVALRSHDCIYPW